MPFFFFSEKDFQGNIIKVQIAQRKVSDFSGGRGGGRGFGGGRGGGGDRGGRGGGGGRGINNYILHSIYSFLEMSTI